MLKFCRSCGKELAHAEDRLCNSCGANAVKGTTYCRYCGHPTSVDDSVCSFCGASIKPLPSSVRTLFEYPRVSAKIGKIINLSLVVVAVTLYIVFTLPKSVTKPIKTAASDAIQASTGYTALPLSAISAVPAEIPPYPPNNPPVGNVWFFYPGDTTQLTIWAIFKNTSSNISAGISGQVREVTNNATYRSDNPEVATVSTSGLVYGISPGFAIITVTYTAPPGSANISDAASGKIPKTVEFQMPVTVIPNRDPAYRGQYWVYY